MDEHTQQPNTVSKVLERAAEADPNIRRELLGTVTAMVGFAELVFGQKPRPSWLGFDQLAAFTQESVAVLAARAHEGAQRRGDVIPCKAGCAACCSSFTVTAQPIEVIRIATHMAKTFGQEAVDQMANCEPAPATCPVLDTATQMCRAYNLRPRACAGYIPRSMNDCTTAIDAVLGKTPPAASRVLLMPQTISGLVEFALGGVAERNGYQGQNVFLRLGLRRVARIGIEKAQSEYAKGRMVFPSDCEPPKESTQRLNIASAISGVSDIMRMNDWSADACINQGQQLSGGN